MFAPVLNAVLTAGRRVTFQPPHNISFCTSCTDEIKFDTVFETRTLLFLCPTQGKTESKHIGLTGQRFAKACLAASSVYPKVIFQ